MNRYLEFHYSWKYNYTSEALIPYLNNISDEKNTLQQYKDERSQVKFIITDMLDNCIKTFLKVQIYLTDGSTLLSLPSRRPVSTNIIGQFD